jgi:integrase
MKMNYFLGIDLRHTTATLLLNENVNPIVVSKRVGHSRTSVTLDTYGQLLLNLQEEVAETINVLITPVPVDCKFYESVILEVLPSPN